MGNSGHRSRLTSPRHTVIPAKAASVDREWRLCDRFPSVVVRIEPIVVLVVGKDARGVLQYGNVLLQFCNLCAQRLDPTFLLLNFLQYCHRNLVRGKCEQSLEYRTARI